MDFSRLGGTGLSILKLRQHPAAELSEFPGHVCSQGELLASADGQQFAPAGPALRIASFSCSDLKAPAAHISTS